MIPLSAALEIIELSAFATIIKSSGLKGHPWHSDLLRGMGADSLPYIRTEAVADAYMA